MSTTQHTRDVRLPAEAVRHGLLAAACLCVLLTTSVSAADPHPCDSITVGNDRYPVPDKWCPARIAPADRADPKTLAPLPQKLTFEDYRIYVTRETRDAFVRMAAAAEKDSVKLIADSGYRSASFQLKIIRRRLEEGQQIGRILRDVAPPGYSEHQTGRALDLIPSEARFAHTRIYTWLKEHAHRFGFYETYPDSTGSPHPWESWHWTYRGESSGE